MKHLTLLLFVCVCLPYAALSQDFHYNISVNQVRFSGSGYIPIRDDSTAIVYTGAHWSTITKPLPAAFISGNKMTVAADFSFTCAHAPDSVTIRATGDDTINFAAKIVPLTLMSSGVYAFTYPVTTGSKAFTNGVVNYYANYQLQWDISFDHGTSWTPVDTTDHKIYVTRSAPMAETANFKYFRTVLDLSCKNAKNETTDTGIISHCWQEFLDHVVLNYKGDSLFYYKAMNSPYVTLPTLLKYRDAECYTFAQLFLAMIKIQGVVRTGNYSFIQANNAAYPCGNVGRFLVKNWTFGTASATSACSVFPYKNTYTGTYLTAGGYVWLSSDVTDATGVLGQCTKNPSSLFNNHQIVKLDGKYYDACYGMTFNAISDIKGAAFDGWAISATSSSPATVFFSNDLSKADLLETITTW